MNKILGSIKETIKQKKSLFIILVLLTIAISVLAVYSAISFNSLAITLDIGNVAFIKFLRGDSGIVGFLFGALLTCLVFYAIILFCCCKKSFFLVAIVFYLYFVYSQMVIFTSIMIIYGFFNVIILILILIAFLVCEFLLFILLILELQKICGSVCYFKDCFNKNLCNVLAISILLVAINMFFCILLILLKSFVILLVF